MNEREGGMKKKVVTRKRTREPATPPRENSIDSDDECQPSTSAAPNNWEMERRNGQSGKGGRGIDNRATSKGPPRTQVNKSNSVPPATSIPRLRMNGRLLIGYNSTGAEVLQKQGAVYEDVPPPSVQPPPIRRTRRGRFIDPKFIDIGENTDARWLEIEKELEKNNLTILRGIEKIIDLDAFSSENFRKLVGKNKNKIHVVILDPPTGNDGKRGEWWTKLHDSYVPFTEYLDYQSEQRAKELSQNGNQRRRGENKESVKTVPVGQLAEKKIIIKAMNELPANKLAFGTNYDIDGSFEYHSELLKIIKKIPRPLGVNLPDDLLHYCELMHGLNVPQAYFKVPGVRTAGHTENNCIGSVNINVGPGSSVWYAVPFYAWKELHQQLQMQNKEWGFFNCEWWPCAEELFDLGIDVIRYEQKANETVYVGYGCVHWVEAQGVCNNISWNRAPTTLKQLEFILEQYEENKELMHGSLVAVQDMAWMIAKEKYKKDDEEIKKFILGLLIRSLNHQKHVWDWASEKWEYEMTELGKHETRCPACKEEMFNFVFRRKEVKDESKAKKRKIQKKKKGEEDEDEEEEEEPPREVCHKCAAAAPALIESFLHHSSMNGLTTLLDEYRGDEQSASGEEDENGEDVGIEGDGGLDDSTVNMETTDNQSHDSASPSKTDSSPLANSNTSSSSNSSSDCLSKALSTFPRKSPHNHTSTARLRVSQNDQQSTSGGEGGKALDDGKMGEGGLEDNTYDMETTVNQSHNSDHPTKAPPMSYRQSPRHHASTARLRAAQKDQQSRSVGEDGKDADDGKMGDGGLENNNSDKETADSQSHKSDCTSKAPPMSYRQSPRHHASTVRLIAEQKEKQITSGGGDGKDADGGKSGDGGLDDKKSDKEATDSQSHKSNCPSKATSTFPRESPRHHASTARLRAEQLHQHRNVTVTKEDEETSSSKEEDKAKEMRRSN